MLLKTSTRPDNSLGLSTNTTGPEKSGVTALTAEKSSFGWPHDPVQSFLQHGGGMGGWAQIEERRGRCQERAILHSNPVFPSFLSSKPSSIPASSVASSRAPKGSILPG